VKRGEHVPCTVLRRGRVVAGADRDRSFPPEMAATPERAAPNDAAPDRAHGSALPQPLLSRRAAAPARCRARWQRGLSCRSSGDVRRLDAHDLNAEFGGGPVA